MKNKIIISILITALLFISIFTFVIIYKDNNIKKDTNNEDKNINNNILAQIDIKKNTENELINTSSIEEKISPNSILIEKKYFKKCDHLVKKIKYMPEELINLTEKEIEKTFPNYKIEKFTKDEVVLYKEEDGICNEHYIVKENNGVIGIYNVDENGKLFLKENTEIQTQYLPQVDVDKLKAGIEVLGDNELNSILEDYE